MSCRCLRPLPSSDPRHLNTCNRCARQIPPPKPKPAIVMNCDRCGDRFEPHRGRVGIFLSPGGSVVEELKATRVYQLCPDCGETLKTWLKTGLRPHEYIELHKNVGAGDRGCSCDGL